MKYASYILIFILAGVAGFLVFRNLRGSGDLTNDFDLRSKVSNQQPVTSNQGNDTLGLVDDINTSGDSPSDSADPGSRDARPDVEYTKIGDEIMITDGVKHLVPLDKILGGGPPKDGIPSIDDPKFISVAEASKFLDDNKLGIAVESAPSSDGVRSWRFYPFQILVWHEIVNDNFKGEPLLVTYCPLCQTGIVFTPIVEGEAVEFGTSGRLYNSNLVMYDRKTDTLWSQQGGRAIVGKLTGAKLKIRAADNVFWGEFKDAHPNAQVLSRDTGQARDYTRDPYGDYYTTAGTYFPVVNTDDRLFDKAITYGLDINGQTKAYSEESIKRDKVINDELAGVNLLVVVEPETQAVRFFNRSINKQVLNFELNGSSLLDKETGSEWNFDGEGLSGAMSGQKLERINPEFGFWFAWVAFHPETLLYN